MTFPCFITTQPKPTRDALQSKTNPIVPYGKVITRAKVSLSFNIWKFLSNASDHSNFIHRWVKVVKGDALDAKLSTNLLYYPTKPKKILVKPHIFIRTTRHDVVDVCPGNKILF